MKIAFKIAITLTALAHFFGFAQAAFMPIEFLKPFGVEYVDSMNRLVTHFGFLLLIFAVFQSLSAIWAFQNKIEGFRLGCIVGLMMIAIFLLDLVLVQNQAPDYPILVLGVVTGVTAFLSMRSEKVTE